MTGNIAPLGLCADAWLFLHHCAAREVWIVLLVFFFSSMRVPSGILQRPKITKSTGAIRRPRGRDRQPARGAGIQYPIGTLCVDCTVLHVSKGQLSSSSTGLP